MAYRGDVAALETRRALLEQRIFELRAKARELDGLKGQEAELQQQLASTTALLEKMAPRRALPVLDAVKIASPCSADWSSMKGDDRVRFCGGCEKNVYNLSAMDRADAEALLRAKEGNLCARLYRRSDGTVITADCPVGAKRVRRRKLALAAVGGSVLSAMAMLGVRYTLTATMGEPAVMGKMAMPAQYPPETMQSHLRAAEPPEMEMGDVATPLPPKVTSRTPIKLERRPAVSR
jgi:hypothetical protein